MIDWKRVAKPQPDGYDSHVIAASLFDVYGWKKIAPAADQLFTMCDGAIAVTEDPTIRVEYPDTNINMLSGFQRWNEDYAKKIDPFLRTWTDGHEMLKLFLDQFWPKWSTFMGEHGMGCSSGHYEMASALRENSNTKHMFLNAVYVTINSPHGCAEGIYHEVGHARLESIGLGINEHDSRLILNTQDELYSSPIRRDKKRPMSAVIQAIYSWIVFGENDIQNAIIPGHTRCSAEYLITNLPKIEDGLKEIRQHVRCTPEGTAFMDGYFEWGEDVVSRARVICQTEFGDNFEQRYQTASKYKENQPIPLT